MERYTLIIGSQRDVVHNVRDLRNAIQLHHALINQAMDLRDMPEIPLEGQNLQREPEKGKGKAS